MAGGPIREGKGPEDCVRGRAFSTVKLWEARQFEAGVRRLDEDGEPLLLVI